MRIFTVRFSATHEDCFHPAYKQGYEATLNDYCWATWNTPGDVTIQEKYVKAETATYAIIKFRKWQDNGCPDSWLCE